jgi:hypothetical protein
MPLPPAPRMPTLREVIDKAIAQGCKLVELKGQLVGPRGPVRARYLRCGKVVYPLPNLPDDWQLAPTVLASMVRSLGIEGYDHLISHLN